MTSATDPLGYQVSLTYNTAGQPLTVSDPTGSIVFTYKLGLLGTTSDSLGNTSQLYYDPVGRVVQKLNPSGGKTTYNFDAMNQVTQVTDPVPAITNFQYDPNGNLLSVTDARQNPTTYTYTNMDRVQTRTDALLKGESRTYDLNGNLVTFTECQWNQNRSCPPKDSRHVSGALLT